MISVGLISYSLYLWHWPLISYLHIIHPNPKDWMVIIALIASFVLSILVYVGVENPMRRYKGVANKYVIGAMCMSLVLCFGLGQTIREKQGFEHRPINVNTKEFQVYTDWLELHKVLQNYEIGSVSVYTSDKTQFPEILFVGDSHINQYVARASLLAKKTGKTVAFVSVGGCFTPVGYEKGGDEKCKKIPQLLDKLHQDDRVKTVVWGHIWGRYLQKETSLFKRGLQILQSWVVKNPERKHFVLLDFPWDDSTYDLRRRFVTNRLSEFDIDRSKFIVDYPGQNDWRDGNEYVVQHLQGVSFIETESKVCPGRKCNLLKSYRDDDHLRASYVKDHATWIDQVFE